MDMLGKAVLIYVEDDIAIRSEVASYLSRRVKQIYQADNGAQGLALIEKYDPDVVITDLEMPVMNGLDMIKKIREIYNGNKPIIVITGYGDEEHYTELADAYIYKPINLKKLVETMERLIEEYKIFE